MNPPTYHSRINVRAPDDGAPKPRCPLFQLPNREQAGQRTAHASELTITCADRRCKCEWLERGPKCGWFGDEFGVGQFSGRYPKRLDDCIKEGAPER